MPSKRRTSSTPGRASRTLRARLAAAEQAVQIHRRVIDALHRIAALALREQPLRAVLQEIVQEVSAATSFPIVAIEFYDEDRQLMEFVAATGMPMSVGQGDRRVSVAKTLSGMVARSGQAVIEPRAQDRPEYADAALRQLGVQTFICLPLSVTERVIGTLALAHPSAVPLDAHIIPLASSLANVIAALVARTQAEAERQVALAKYRTLFDTFPLGITVSDATGQIIETNTMAERLLGLGREEQHQREINGAEWRIVRPDGSPMPADEYASVRALTEQRLVENVEMGVITPSGETTWLNVTAAPLPLDDYGVVITYGDITARKAGEAAARESEQSLQHFLNNSPDTIYLMDLTTHTSRFLNRDSFLGYSRQELETENSILAAVHPDDRPAVVDQWRAITGSAASPSAPVFYRVHNRQGDWEWLQQRATVLSWTNRGAPHKVLITLSVITEHKQAELALRASEEQYRSLMESLDSLVAIVDASGQVRYINDLGAALAGRAPSQWVGKNLGELFAEPAAESQLAAVRQVIRADRGAIFESQMRVNGAARWYRTSIQPIHDDQGYAVHALVNATDIDVLKTTQQTLLEVNRTLEERVAQRTAEVQDLYDNAPIGYHSLDSAGRIVRINQTELDWLGYTREELIGRSPSIFIAPASQPVFAMSFPLLKQQGWVRGVDVEMIRKDGSTFPALISATAVYDEAGGFVMSRSTLVDITQRKQAEAALRHANAELARAGRDKDAFLANMSHELRTPLNAILGFSEILRAQIRGSLNPAQQDAVHNIETSGQHLLALINDILDLSKVEAGRLDLALEPVMIAQVCQASLLFVKELALKKSLRVDLLLSDPLAQMQADPRRLKQMLVNLLANAVKFTDGGGHVSLEVEIDATTGAVRFTVQDTGIGIAQEDLARLFQPFSQVDSALGRQHEGSGLGLALVRRLAELHGGRVTVESTVGVGSRFTITLPAGQPEPAGRPPYEDPRADPPGEAGAAGAARGSRVATDTPAGVRVLVVDDNEANLLMIAEYLRARGYDVAMIHSGQEALDRIGSVNPAVILMDIQMPDLDGLEVIHQLRANAAYATTPIIALTALAMPGDRERCLAAGASAYLAKPVSLRKLAELITQVVRA